MPDYSLCKIYKVINNVDNEIYIGSTTQLLCRRMAVHRCLAKNNLSTCRLAIHKHMASVGVDKCYIELVENYPCKSKEEQHKREGEWIRQIGTLNNKVAGRNHKDYRLEDPEHYKQKNIQYNEKHKEYICEYLACALCGNQYMRKNRSRHQQTLICKNTSSI